MRRALHPGDRVDGVGGVFSGEARLFSELFQAGVYKRSQGRITRQVTFAAVAIVVALGLFRLSQALIEWGQQWQYGLPGALLLRRTLGLLPGGERAGLRRFSDRRRSGDEQGVVADAARVVPQLGGRDLVTIFFLAVVLFGFDAVVENRLQRDCGIL